MIRPMPHVIGWLMGKMLEYPMTAHRQLQKGRAEEKSGIRSGTSVPVFVFPAVAQRPDESEMEGEMEEENEASR
jgi:hypothetical protein